jgi:hypothetical protein
MSHFDTFLKQPQRDDFAQLNIILKICDTKFTRTKDPPTNVVRSPQGFWCIAQLFFDKNAMN